MRSLIASALAGLVLLSSGAHADHRGNMWGGNVIINAGSGLVIQHSVAEAGRHQSQPGNHRHDYHHRSQRSRAGLAATPGNGDRPVNWRDTDYRNSQPSWNDYNYRYAVEERYDQEVQREGRYLRDRSDNCYRIDGEGRFERRVKVRSSYCRF